MVGAAAAALTALQVGCLLAGPKFDLACEIVRATLKGPTGYDKPTSWSFQGADAVQGLPAMPGAEEALLSERQFIDPHLEAAIRLDHPLASTARRARKDLKAAVQWVCNTPHTRQAVELERDAVTAALDRAQKILTPVDEEIAKLFSPAVKRLLGDGASMALTAVCARVMELPDDHFVSDMVSGFQAYGKYPATGMFQDRDRPALRAFCSLDHAANNRNVISRCEKRGGTTDPRLLWQLSEITRKSDLEVEKGLADRVLSVSEIDDALRALNPDHVDGCYQLLSTFGVSQGYDEQGRPKVRRCDNCKASLTNECLGTEETISCEEASFPALVAMLFSDTFQGELADCPLALATDDVDSAYRRLACRNAEASVVAVWHTVLEMVVFYTMPGHNFGLASAVLSFNRYTQFATCVMRRLYGSPTAAYFDDYCMVEPLWCGDTAKRALLRVHRMLGMPLAVGAKNVPFRFANPFLGVITDLARFHVDGSIVIKSKPERVAKIVTTMSDALLEGAMPAGERKSTAGKLVYTTGSTGYARVGRAAIRLLYEPCEADDAISWGLAEALRFFIAILPILPPRVMRMRGRRLRPIVVYTDAMYEDARSPPGRIGIVIYDPEAPEPPSGPDGAPPVDDAADYRWRHSSAEVTREFLEIFAPRQQYITQLEMLAALLAYTSRPKQFHGRDVIHFVDNSGSLAILTGGYSREADCSRMTHFFHAISAALQCRVWFEYVASGANIADLPSRGEFAKLIELSSVPFTAVWPDLGESWSASFASAFAKYAPRPGKAALRLRSAIQRATELIQSRRAQA